MLMAVAVTALTGWMILAHNLWERPSKNRKKHLARLYNSATILTIGFGVLCYYSVLFLSFFLAVFLFIPTSMLESPSGVGQKVGFPFYLSLAWITTSLARCVGALGSGLENEETVLKGTYGYRQLQRRQAAKQEEEKSETNQNYMI